LVIRYGGEIIVNSDATSGTNWEAVSGTGTPVVFRRPHTRLLPH
jgi:hypothetical protein